MYYLQIKLSIPEFIIFLQNSTFFDLLKLVIMIFESIVGKGMLLLNQFALLFHYFSSLVKEGERNLENYQKVNEPVSSAFLS